MGSDPAENFEEILAAATLQGQFSLPPKLLTILHSGEINSPELLAEWLDVTVLQTFGRADAQSIAGAYCATGAADLNALNAVHLLYSDSSMRPVRSFDARQVLGRYSTELQIDEAWCFPICLGVFAATTCLPPDLVIRRYLNLLLSKQIEIAAQCPGIGQNVGPQIAELFRSLVDDEVRECLDALQTEARIWRDASTRRNIGVTVFSD